MVSSLNNLWKISSLHLQSQENYVPVKFWPMSTTLVKTLVNISETYNIGVDYSRRNTNNIYACFSWQSLIKNTAEHDLQFPCISKEKKKKEGARLHGKHASNSNNLAY